MGKRAGESARCKTLYQVKKKEPTSHLTRPPASILLVVHAPLGIDDGNYESFVSELHFSGKVPKILFKAFKDFIGHRMVVLVLDCFVLSRGFLMLESLSTPAYGVLVLFINA